MSYYVYVICPAPKGFRKKPPCEIRHPAPNLAEAALCFKILRHPDGWNWFRARCYRKEVKRFKPDVVHAMEAYAYGFALAKCKGFPRVLMPWGNDIFVDPFRTRLAGYLVRYALHHAEAITTNMPNLADYLEPQFGVNRERVRAFSWGVDLDIFHTDYKEDANALRKRWNLPGDAFIILSPRQMREYWGMVEIAEAFGRVAAQRPKAHIVFLRGMGEPGLERASSPPPRIPGCWGIRVRWVGDVLDACGMAAAFNLADVFISVPKSDMLSISVLEGMACGCLPVAADLLAYRSRLKHWENALLVPMPVTGEKTGRGDSGGGGASRMAPRIRRKKHRHCPGAGRLEKERPAHRGRLSLGH